MDETDTFDTSTTLLRLLRDVPPDQAAWDRFVERYGRLLYVWCRRWGLQQADAEDVTQNVLLDLARQMKDFDYDPRQRFRGWLHTVAYRSWCRFVAARNRREASAAREETQEGLDRLCSPEAHSDFLARLHVEAERELLEMAKEAVRGKVQPRTWEAFRLTAEQELSGAEVARRLDMKVGTVFVARSKVQKMIRDEFLRLEREAG
jgi:RNA polymerase sigma-70 factor (ECF subfamily)